jgi:hypothetical protein
MRAPSGGLLVVMTWLARSGRTSAPCAKCRHRTFGNPANARRDGTDPFAIFTNSSNADQLGRPVRTRIGPAIGGRWAVTARLDIGDASTLVTSWAYCGARCQR